MSIFIEKRSSHAIKLANKKISLDLIERDHFSSFGSPKYMPSTVIRGLNRR